MINIVCVLKSGGVYNASYALALSKGVRTNITIPYQFFCLTDFDSAELPGIDVIPLLYDWSGWWSVAEAWGPGLPRQRTLYIDLDTLVTGNLNDIAQFDKSNICCLEDFYFSGNPANGIMNFAPGALEPFWRVLRDTPKKWINEGGRMKPPHFGNMIFWKYRQLLQVELPVFWQETLPGQVVSYKVHCRNQEALPEGARLVCSHGTPKPPDIEDSWYKKLWLEYTT